MMISNIVTTARTMAHEGAQIVARAKENMQQIFLSATKAFIETKPPKLMEGFNGFEMVQNVEPIKTIELPKPVLIAEELEFSPNLGMNETARASLQGLRPTKPPVEEVKIQAPTTVVVKPTPKKKEIRIAMTKLRPAGRHRGTRIACSRGRGHRNYNLNRAIKGRPNPNSPL